LRSIRDFFHSEEVLEVTTPTLRLSGSSEIHLENIQVGRQGYLQTSPEYAMKCLVAEHRLSIFQICPAYRGGEIGRRHRVEFQMLEWYRCEHSLPDLMDDLQAMLKHVSEQMGEFNIEPITRIVDRYSYRELFEKHLKVNPHSVEVEGLAGLVASKITTHLDERATLGDYLDAVFSDAIEPQLLAPTIVYDFPACQAALAETKQLVTGDVVSDRFEFYVGGVEIANAYQELGDGQELTRRFAANNEQRQLSGKPIIEDDIELLAVIDDLPRCAGIALGIDRLTMALRGLEDIAGV
jgi:lysyl-tRNA synthetase class 2